MSDYYLGEIRIMAFKYAPKGWARCDGQILPISQNTKLFSLIGTFYGGDGKTTFGLPNLQGSVPISQGQSPGGSQYKVGQSGGAENVTLQPPQMPEHNHAFTVTTTVGTTDKSNGNQLGRGQIGNPISGMTQIRIYSPGTPDRPMSQNLIKPEGGNRPHNNMMPYMAFTFCIAMTGPEPPAARTAG